MKKTIAALTAMLLLSACSQTGNNEISEAESVSEPALSAETVFLETTEDVEATISEI